MLEHFVRGSRQDPESPARRVSYELTCPNCGKQFQTPEAPSGRQFRCDDCGHILRIPVGAKSFKGFGTAYYGERDYWPDGSYVTTEWIIFAYIPIVPIRSHRVRHLGTRGIPPFYFREEYVFLGTTSPNWKQVLCIYAFMVFIACWNFALLRWVAPMQWSMWWWCSIAVLGLSPALIPFVFRSIAKRKLGQRSRSMARWLELWRDRRKRGRATKEEPKT